jgi:hypothetical protein
LSPRWWPSATLEQARAIKRIAQSSSSSKCRTSSAKDHRAQKMEDLAAVPSSFQALEPSNCLLEIQRGDDEKAPAYGGMGGFDVSSRSRALLKARGEIQRGAGTATWSRVSCRMRGIGHIHHPLGRLDKQPTERNSSDRQILRPWTFATALNPRGRTSRRSSGHKTDEPGQSVFRSQNRRTGQNVPSPCCRWPDSRRSSDACRGAAIRSRVYPRSVLQTTHSAKPMRAALRNNLVLHVRRTALSLARRVAKD